MSTEFKKFLGAVFSAQTETFDVEIKSLAYWHDTMSGRLPLSDEASAALLGSPLNRKLYDQAYRARRNQSLGHAANLQHAPRLRAAASGAGRQPVHIDGMSGVRIAIRPLGGGGWHIMLDVSDLGLPVGGELQLCDDQGRAWLTDIVPQESVLFGRWPFEVDPDDIMIATQAIAIFLDGLPLLSMTPLDRGAS